MAAFPDSALTGLGRGAVRRYYAAQCEGVPGAVNLVATAGDRIVAFCFSGVFEGPMTRFLVRHAAFLVGAVAVHPRIVFSRAFRAQAPGGLRLVWRYLARGLRRAPNATVPPPTASAPRPEPSFNILAIATDPASQRRGAAKALMNAATAEAERRGFRKMMLSVHPDNHAAVAFYEGLGWRRRLHAGSWRGLMERSIEGQR